MPVLATYPGVYIQEIPSGVRTITGVATSVTAFIGRALRGPDDTAVAIKLLGDRTLVFPEAVLEYESFAPVDSRLESPVTPSR